VFEGAPLVAGVALSPEGGELVVRGELAHGEVRQGHPYRVATEAWIQRITVPPKRGGEGNQAIAALYAREHVADLETRWTIGDQHTIDREIEAVGVKFQIATRLTSWVAVDEESRVDVEKPSRHEVQPQQLPYGTSMASFGLRGAAMPQPAMKTMMLAGSIAPVEEELGSVSGYADFDDVSTGSGMPAQPMPAPMAQPMSGEKLRMAKRSAGMMIRSADIEQSLPLTKTRRSRLPMVLVLALLAALIAFLVWWLVL
jgi:Ca-activated chloride channel family protein